MSQGITIKSGYGWIIDKGDGDWAANLEQLMSDEQRIDVVEAVEQLAKDEGIAVVAETFGYHFACTALLAKDSLHTSYDFVHDINEHTPNKVAEPQFRRELLQALDELGWDEAGLEEPTWLLLALFG